MQMWFQVKMSLPLTASNQDQMAQIGEEVSMQRACGFICPTAQREIGSPWVILSHQQAGSSTEDVKPSSSRNKR